MFARAPIIEDGLKNVTFNTDMMKVWGVISVIMRDLYCWTYVKSAQRTRYGSKAYCDLWEHFLEPDNVDNMASDTKRLFVATHSSGKRKR